MKSFNFSMYFVSVLPKNGHFDHFWDTQWGFTDPTTDILWLIMYGAYLSISWMTIKICLHEKFQFFNVFCNRFNKKWAL